MQRGLEGRIALITGASRGIGLATARVLADEGARVVMLARGASELHARAREIGAAAFVIGCDVVDSDAVKRSAAILRDHFSAAPDIVVNSAGLFQLATVETTLPDDFARTLDVNLMGPFLIAQVFLREMRERGSGHIVMIGSIADRHTYPENGAYAASKFGVRALHEVLRSELVGTGVRATLISPGPVDTQLWDHVGLEGRDGFTPRANMLTADAVANAIRYAVTQPATVNVEELRIGRT